MKKLKFLILIAIVVSFAACDEGSEAWCYLGDTVKDPLQVTAVDRMFEPEGGTNQVTLNKVVNTVYSSESWATAAVSGNTVSVTTTENNDRFNRHANIVIKAAENDSVIVTITQKGLVFSIDGDSEFTVGNEATQKTVYITANTAVNVESAPDWITASLTDDGAVLNIAENNTGNFRKGIVTFNAGSNTVSVSVLQGEAKDLAGSYYFVGTNPKTGEQSVLLAEATYADGSLTVTFPDLGWSWTAPVNDGLYFDINTGTCVGTYDAYYVGLILKDYDANVQTYNTSRSYRCQFDYDDENETIVGRFVDNGSWSGYTVSGIRFDAFKTSTIDSSSRTGITLIQFYEPWMMKIPTASSSSSSAD